VESLRQLFTDSRTEREKGRQSQEKKAREKVNKKEKKDWFEFLGSLLILPCPFLFYRLSQKECSPLFLTFHHPFFALTLLSKTKKEN